MIDTTVYRSTATHRPVCQGHFGSMGAAGRLATRRIICFSLPNYFGLTVLFPPKDVLPAPEKAPATFVLLAVSASAPATRSLPTSPSPTPSRAFGMTSLSSAGPTAAGKLALAASSICSCSASSMASSGSLSPLRTNRPACRRRHAASRSARGWWPGVPPRECLPYQTRAVRPGTFA